MKEKLIIILMLATMAIGTQAQERKVQNKPYIDLRTLHFGILLGLHMQDVEMDNVGPQVIDLPEGGQIDGNVLCDQDNWNPGFSVGVLADLRLSQHFNLRFSPSMHFGQKRLTFRNMLDLDDSGKPRLQTQDLKNTYLSLPVDLKFSAERFNNYRPYILAGINPMLNLAGKDQDYVQLKKQDLMVEVGLGCDFYLPFFKLIPELKFCYSLSNTLDKDHVSELRDTSKLPYACSVSGAHTKMVVLTLYFE
mgnify:CR=1 FL=1